MLSRHPRDFGADAFAADGAIWIVPQAFRPDTMEGLALIGHELAHLHQQSRMVSAGTLHVLDDPVLEAEAEAFGAAFADPGLLGAIWAEAPHPPRPPVGVAQCSYSKPKIPTARPSRPPPPPPPPKPLAQRIVEDDFDYEDDDDEEDGVGASPSPPPPSGPPPSRPPPPPPGTAPRPPPPSTRPPPPPPPPRPGARDAASSTGRSVQSVANTSRVVSGAGLSVFNTGAGAAGGTGMVGFVTGAMVPGVGAALAPIALVTGPVAIALSLIDVGLSAKSAHSTYGHIKKLEMILTNFATMPGVQPSTLTALAFVLNKKNKKLKRKGLGCIPILGSICNTVYTLGRTIQKTVEGTKGIERRRAANVLWGNMMGGDRAAIAACSELLGADIFVTIRKYSDGHLVLKKKMKSL